MECVLRRPVQERGVRRTVKATAQFEHEIGPVDASDVMSARALPAPDDRHAIGCRHTGLVVDAHELGSRWHSMTVCTFVTQT